MNKRSTILGLIILTTLIGVGLTGYWLFGTKNSRDESPADVLNQASRGSDVIIISAEGRVQPVQFANLSFEIGGIVTKILIAEGDKVEQGTPLIQLDGSELIIAETQAELNLAQSELELQLAEAQLAAANLTKESADIELQTANADMDLLIATLAEVGATAPEQIAIAELNISQAQKAVQQATNQILQVELMVEQARLVRDLTQKYLELAQIQVNKSTLRAPFDGTIISLDIEIGETLTPGFPVIMLADLDDWQVVTTDLTEIDVVNIDLDTLCDVRVDAFPLASFRGRVMAISEFGQLDRGDVIYRVTIDLPSTSERLFWGMTAIVTFEIP